MPNDDDFPEPISYGVVQDRATNLPDLAQVLAPDGSLFASVHATDAETALARAERIARLLHEDDVSKAEEVARQARYRQRAIEEQARLEARRAAKAVAHLPPAKLVTRKPGVLQLNILRCLIEHGSFGPSCGWTWSTYGETEKVVQSLARRGLAAVEDLPNGSRRYTPILSLAAEFYERHRGKERPLRPRN